MAVGIPGVRGISARVCARQDMPGACRCRELRHTPGRPPPPRIKRAQTGQLAAVYVGLACVRTSSHTTANVAAWRAGPGEVGRRRQAGRPRLLDARRPNR